jgi:hypothetical protein
VERLKGIFWKVVKTWSIEVGDNPGLGLGGVLYSEECKESVVTPGHVIQYKKVDPDPG